MWIPKKTKNQLTWNLLLLTPYTQIWNHSYRIVKHGCIFTETLKLNTTGKSCQSSLNAIGEDTPWAFPERWGVQDPRNMSALVTQHPKLLPWSTNPNPNQIIHIHGHAPHKLPTHSFESSNIHFAQEMVLLKWPDFNTHKVTQAFHMHIQKYAAVNCDLWVYFQQIWSS